MQVAGGGMPTYWQLACPGRGQVIGGLDADRGGRLELSFLGRLGGPVGPGVTTGRAAVFVARTTQPLAAFRPLLGCIPASGGGGRGRTFYESKRQLTMAAPLPEPTIRRVKSVRVRLAATQRVGHGCPAGEQPLAFSHAIAFRTNRVPPPLLLASVRASARRTGDRVTVTVRSGTARTPSARVELQVHAICARRGA